MRNEKIEEWNGRGIALNSMLVGYLLQNALLYYAPPPHRPSVQSLLSRWDLRCANALLSCSNSAVDPLLPVMFAWSVLTLPNVPAGIGVVAISSWPPIL